MHRMLHLDPVERATIPEIFNHPWLRGNTGLVSHFDSLGANDEVTEREPLPQVGVKQKNKNDKEDKHTKGKTSVTTKASSDQRTFPKQQASPPKVRSRNDSTKGNPKRTGESELKGFDATGKIVAHREAILPAEERSPHSRPGRRRISARESTKLSPSPNRKAESQKLPAKPSN